MANKQPKKQSNRWYTEAELGDLFWLHKDDIFFLNFDKSKWFREFKIGRGRVDFAYFVSHYEHNLVELFELKITITKESIVQVLRYQEHLEEYLRTTFYQDNINHKRCPKIKAYLVGRYVDTGLYELCRAADISIYRISLENGFSLDLDLDADPSFPDVPQDHILENTLLDFFEARSV